MEFNGLGFVVCYTNMDSERHIHLCPKKPISATMTDSNFHCTVILFQSLWEPLLKLAKDSN